MTQELDKATKEKHKDISIALLHKYIDHLAERNFFGQTSVSWEHGRPIILKENSTLRMDDVEKILSQG